MYISPFVCGIVFTIIAEIVALMIIVGINIKRTEGEDNYEEENKDKED